MKLFESARAACQAGWNKCRNTVIVWKLQLELKVWLWHLKRWVRKTMATPYEEAMGEITNMRRKLATYPPSELVNAYGRLLDQLERSVQTLHARRQQANGKVEHATH